MEFLKIYRNVSFLILSLVHIGEIEPTYVKPLFEYRIKAIEDNSDRAYDVECEVHSSKYIAKCLAIFIIIVFKKVLK